MIDAILHPRNAAWLVAAAGAAILGAALAFQYLGGLAPCELCYWQRYPFWVAIPAGVAAACLPAARPYLLALAGVALAIGAGVAVFHVGVEQQWWQGTQACGARGPAASIEELRARLLGAPVVRCDAPQWALFGVTMAGYNVALSGGLALFALIGARRAWKER
ncbi:MAG: disulfide bond formation protein B [Tagaea sp.]